MNRREWFMQLGAGVVLAGCNASDLDAAELPPGVYEPSRDHLSHALAGHGLGAGSETELVQARSPFFGPDEGPYIVIWTAALLGETPDSPVVREVADWIDLVVGESSAVRKAALALTPAHRTLAVHYYGAKAVQELEELDPQAICREGLTWFKSGNPGESIALQVISDDRPEPRVENAGTRFFTYLKGRVIEGFYTSRAGLEELGRGNPNFYASPPGCSNK
jgi:hypothetical protein